MHLTRSRPRAAAGRVIVGAAVLCSVRSVAAQEAPPARPNDDAATTTAPAGSASAPGSAPDYNLDPGSPGAGKFLWSALDVAAVNLTLWAIPYAAGSPFVQIDPSDWPNNFRVGPQWDDGEFEINQFSHPYQGSLYFSAARVNGLSFWEAAPYTLLGSFMWEFFLETEQPSISDFWTTTWGGAFMGETLYRLSNAILDDSTSGSGRFVRELAALAVNPMNGLDRLVSGQAWADGPAGKRFPLDVDFRLGVDGLGLSEGTGWGKTGRARIRFDYGDLFAEPALRTPFEAFHFAVQLSASKSIFGQGIDGTGVLLGHRFGAAAEHANLLAWVLTFEYSTNGTRKLLTRDSSGVYQLGEIGTGPGWFGRWGLGSGFSVHSELDALVVPSGAVTSPYAKYEANRSYDYGLGGALKLELSLRHERFGRLYAQAGQHLYYVMDGAEGTDYVGTFEIGAYANLWSGHGLGFGAIHYGRSSHYHEYPNVTDRFWSGRAHYEVEF